MKVQLPTFYRSETPNEKTEIQAGDLLIFDGGWYSICRGGERLYCADDGETDVFELDQKRGPVNAAMDLAHAVHLSVRFLTPDLKEKGAQYEWKFEKQG